MRSVQWLWAAMALSVFTVCGCSDVSHQVEERLEAQKTQAIERGGEALSESLDKGQERVTEGASEAIRGEEEQGVRDELNGDDESKPGSDERPEQLMRASLARPAVRESLSSGYARAPRVRASRRT